MEESRVFHIREYLEGLHMLMCRIKSNQNQLIRVKNIFSLVITQAPKVNNRKLIISRDVKFNDEEECDCNAQESNYDTHLYEEEEQMRENLQENYIPLS